MTNRGGNDFGMILRLNGTGLKPSSKKHVIISINFRKNNYIISKRAII